MSGDFSPKYIQKGDLLARVYDYTRRYGPLDWNPNRPPTSSTAPAAGRFDILTGDTDPGGFLYCTEAGKDRTEASKNQAVAIVETLRSRMWRDSSKNGRNMLRQADRDCRVLQIFELDSNIVLADIHEQEGRECFRMDEEVQYSSDRECTRQWANFVKSSVDDVAGIAYNSTQVTGRFGFSSMILWQSRMTGITFTPVEQIPLRSREGRVLVEKALMPYRTLIIP